MFSHVMVGADDVATSQAFYDAALGALGIPPAVLDAQGRAIYAHDGGRFMVSRPRDGASASHANGGTIGFLATSPEAADASYAAGLAHGGTPCEDPPGIRTMADGRVLYLAYMRDPAGNKLCLLHRVQA